MKRTLSLFLAAAMTLTAAHAQEAFKELGASLELGTTGIGVNLSLPVVTDHLVVSVGYNFPSFSYSKDVNVGNGYVNKQIQKVIDAAPDKGIKLIDRLGADVEAKLNFSNFKVMLQYYPTTQSSFYVAAGAFFGGGEMINLSGQVDANAWKTYEEAVAINNTLPAEKRSADLNNAMCFNIGDQTFLIRPEDKGHIEAKFKTNSVKPYVGIGFGNSIPQKNRCGFQMELGAYYQGSPALESAQEIPYDIEAIWQKDLADTKDMIKKFAWYPQLTFRITGRLF